MMNLLKGTRNIALALGLLIGATQAFAENTAKDDTQTKAEVAKFADESAKLREDHIQSMRELHLKHVNDMYDMKLAHSREVDSLWKQIKPGDKEGNKAIRKQAKEKQETFKIVEEKFRKDFKENILKKKSQEFREAMKERHKEMKKKFKD